MELPESGAGQGDRLAGGEPDLPSHGRAHRQARRRSASPAGMGAELIVPLLTWMPPLPDHADVEPAKYLAGNEVDP